MGGGGGRERRVEQKRKGWRIGDGDIIEPSRELIKDDGALRRKIGKEGLATSCEMLLTRGNLRQSARHELPRDGIKTNTASYRELEVLANYGLVSAEKTCPRLSPLASRLSPLASLLFPL
jgi:hypothetical protein